MAGRALRLSDVTQGDETAEEIPLPPFFNTTYSIHRASPLYVGSQPLTPQRLSQLSHRLRDVLVGDVVRGIQIGLESTETTAGQVGPLRSVNVRWFEASDILGDEPEATARPRSRDLSSRRPRGGLQGAEEKRGLWIEVRHENAAYVAVLLPAPTKGNAASGDTAMPGWAMQPDEPTTGVSDRNDEQFVHLPLLLMRMPLPLKTVIGTWLSSTFDCRVNKVTLGTKPIVTIWEQWLQTIGVPNKGPDVVVTLGFNAPLPEAAGNKDRGHDMENEKMNEDEDDDEANDGMANQPGLRAMTVTITAQDLRRFVRAGEAAPSPSAPSAASSWTNNPRERRRLAGPNADDGWSWRTTTAPAADRNSPQPRHPFTQALAQYLDAHLALDLFHPSVRVTQIACGGFVLAQSRLKVVRVGEGDEDLSGAAWMFVTELAGRVGGEERLPAIFS